MNHSSAFGQQARNTCLPDHRVIHEFDDLIRRGAIHDLSSIDLFQKRRHLPRRRNVLLGRIEPFVRACGSLRIDSEKERFIDDAQADRLLKREYREPFAVPAV